MLLARYKKLGGSRVAGGLTWRTDEGRSKFWMGVRGDLSTTFHAKGTTFSRANMRQRWCGFSRWGISPRSFTTNGRARFLFLPICACDDGGFSRW